MKLSKKKKKKNCSPTSCSFMESFVLIRHARVGFDLQSSFSSIILRNIKEKKMGKIRRDERDYKEGRIFSFAKRYDDIPVIQRNKSERPIPNRMESPSCSSSELSSVEDAAPIMEKEQTDNIRCSSFLEEVQRIRVGYRRQELIQGEGRGNPETTGVKTRLQMKQQT